MLCNDYDKHNSTFLPKTIYADFKDAVHYSILSVKPEQKILKYADFI